MKRTRFFLTAATAACVAAVMAMDALACSTIVIGKDVSTTGNILVGHNEDNGGRILTAQYWVPPATHAAGEMLTYEPTAAKIPQVAETLGFYWSQTYDPSGASFSDGFFNEAGVAIVSNACTGLYADDVMPVKDGGIGYGIRRLMAERAHSAREAVQIAIDLLHNYGYFSEGRTYTVADSKEAWQIAIHQGDTWVARRIKDNEVTYIPNNFTIDVVDATDTENVLVAPGMIERAIKNGRYKPAQPGVYKDFNYRVAVQPDERRAADYNFSRSQIGWLALAGKKIDDPQAFPYSFTPQKKFSVEDVKAILRSHEKTIGDDPGWYHHKGLGICRPTTHESVVYDLRANPLMTVAWRSLARPCETPYVPLYPLAHPAEATAFLDWQTALKEQFKGTPEHFSYRADWPVWDFVIAANTLDYQRDDLAANAKFMAGLEKSWAQSEPEIFAEAQALYEKSPAKAQEFLHQQNVKFFDMARAKVAAHTQSIAPHKVLWLADQIDPKSDAGVELAVLSDARLDATKINLKRTHAGVGRASVGAKRVVGDLAQPVAHSVRDVDNDGRPDLVLTFKQKDLALETLPGARYDLWLYTFDAAGKRITAFDTIGIATEGYKGPKERTEAADR